MDAIKNKLFIGLLIITAFTFTHTLFAQITIGSGLAPSKGVLLELKEQNAPNGGVNASKGMILPRVKLTSRTNLFPMFGAEASDYQGEEKTKQDKIHTGMIAFNVNTVESEKLATGLNVWDGHEWISVNLHRKPVTEPTIDPNINTTTSKSGIEYQTRIFGKAGEWMIENLRETEYDTDQYNSLAVTGMDKYLTKKVSEYDEESFRHYIYPNNSEETFNKHPEYGLLYSFAATTMGQVTADIQSFEDRPSQVQGICPNGWLVPSNKDWDELREEILDNPDKYADLKPSENQDIEEYLNTVARSPFGVANVTGDNEGKSKKSGVNALLVGRVSNAEFTGYGEITSFWTSTVNSYEYALVRNYQTGRLFSGEIRNYSRISDMNSVRCKRKQQ